MVRPDLLAGSERRPLGIVFEVTTFSAYVDKSAIHLNAWLGDEGVDQG